MLTSRSLVLPLLLSLALVGGLGPASLAKDGVTPAARVNADTVDGKDAVAATGKATQRANKLVATNKQGLLPANILRPLWSLLQGIPAVLADGQVGWGEVTDKPAGFADGTDDAGVTAIRITRVVTLENLPVGTTVATVRATCPAGAVAVGGGHSYIGNVTVVFSFDEEDGSGWKVGVGKPSGETAAVFAIAKCLNVEPGGAFSTAKKGLKTAKFTKRAGHRR